MTTEQAPASPHPPGRPPASAGLDIDALPARELYANREISWLDFNDRVFAEAMDPRNPLRERVRFLAIAASNLDEFYAKRMGWLQSRLRAGDDEETIDGLGVREQLQIVRRRGATMRDRYAACWREDLAPGLAAAGVPVSSYAALSAVQRARVREYFVRDVFPVLTPLVVDPAHPFPFISGGSLSIGANVTDPETGEVRFARVKVPDNRPRFVEAGDGVYVAIEEVIGAHLDLLFPGAAFSDWWLMHLLRNADIDAPGEAADDLREVVGTMIERRRMAATVCVELSADPGGVRGQVLRRELGLAAEDVLVLPSPLRLSDITELADAASDAPAFAAFAPAVPGPFQEADTGDDLFATLRAREVLVHHPYESFDASVARFMRAAAVDPRVLAIKQTMYRTSPDSPLLEAAIRAATLGKQVAVIVELTARFDEANNIEWARRLEDAGVHIAYGRPNRKVHSKMSLVVRDEPDGVRLYGHIGTGNYNSATARVYTDLGLFTADPAVCNDLLSLFNHLTGYGRFPATQQILLSPSRLRTALAERIEREIAHARAGRPARIVFKMNALEDQEFTRLLYAAGRAGVEVDLIVRGICRLRPGVPGLSENIRVVSVIGRFLEHSRVYYFANDGAPEYFIGSADLMKRNLDERVEATAPIRDPRHQAHLTYLFDTMLADERQGWRLVDHTWSRAEESAQPGTHAALLRDAPFS
jgi:polyphosphate kinase